MLHTDQNFLNDPNGDILTYLVYADFLDEINRPDEAESLRLLTTDPVMVNEVYGGTCGGDGHILYGNDHLHYGNGSCAYGFYDYNYSGKGDYDYHYHYRFGRKYISGKGLGHNLAK